MRLSDFIVSNLEPILAEWEAFARTHIPAGEAMDVAALRDHAADILKTVAARPPCRQTRTRAGGKVQGRRRGAGRGRPTPPPRRTVRSGRRPASRSAQMVSEFRALRASVTRLWRAANGPPGPIGLRGPDAVQRGDRPGARRVAVPLRPGPGALEGDVPRHPRPRRPDAARRDHDVGDRAPHDPGPEPAAPGGRVPHPEQRHAASSRSSTTCSTSPGRGSAPASRSPAPKPTWGRSCRQAVEEAAAYHPDRDVRFEASGPLRGSWDGARVSQALSNLVGNAVQHGAYDTPVTVTARGGADDVTVVVHNRGPAILPAHRHQIFSPLKRIRRGDPRPQDAGSMGLGLYIANEIVKGHGGRIDVDSSDASGTTFTVHLPRHPPTS